MINKLLTTLLMALVLAVFSPYSQATEDQISFADEQQAQLYKELIKELRCPKCQNQNIADSNAVVAKDMRVKTKQLLDQGQDKQQVIDYMVNRYGQFAHYQPPINPATIMLWLLPIGFVLFAVFLLFRRSNQGANAAVASSNSTDQAQLDQTLDQELEQLMADKGKDK